LQLWLDSSLNLINDFFVASGWKIWATLFPAVIIFCFSEGEKGGGITGLKGTFKRKNHSSTLIYRKCGD
jgi:hypothetical protein